MYLCAAQTAYKELGYKVHKPTFTYTNSTGLSLHSTKSVFPTLGNCVLLQDVAAALNLSSQKQIAMLWFCANSFLFFFHGHELFCVDEAQ